ncbi:PRC-barrel domain containing protein [Roseomonas hellenica]|uniref:PRC-barrel domain containing protein n=1 Tax=Plastoroseomonas hellenica TaxID=2687306 RepID=A0ABS5EWW9_9PROT|nr:PRC-barrel domain-containing protein [Plastoroseomonas hellenica]MBR0664789.1 PRC-barrel domain containing protein [Plastoroseomonas hellenica]
MRTRREILAGGLACTVIVTAAVPAALAQSTAARTASPASPVADQRRVKALLERDVYSSDNVEIGEIEDLILDAEGRVETAVIELEGRLGFTEKHVAVPFSQLRYDGTQRRFQLQMSREEVRALPAFHLRD